MRSFGGEGGRSSKDHIGSQGEGGGQDGPKKDHIIFERSLTLNAETWEEYQTLREVGRYIKNHKKGVVKHQVQ